MLQSTLGQPITQLLQVAPVGTAEPEMSDHSSDVFAAGLLAGRVVGEGFRRRPHLLADECEHRVGDGREIVGHESQQAQSTDLDTSSHSRPAAIPPVDHLSKVVGCESEAPPQVVGINLVWEPGQGVAVGRFEKPSTLQNRGFAKVWDRGGSGGPWIGVGARL